MYSRHLNQLYFGCVHADNLISPVFKSVMPSNVYICIRRFQPVKSYMVDLDVDCTFFEHIKLKRNFKMKLRLKENAHKLPSIFLRSDNFLFDHHTHKTNINVLTPIPGFR